MKQETYTPNVRKALRKIGGDVAIARKKRRMSMADFAERMGVSQRTLARLEKGEPGVALGSLAMALVALGELSRLEDMIDITRDDAGLLADLAALPQRIRKKSRLAGSGSGGEIDESGVDF